MAVRIRPDVQLSKRDAKTSWFVGIKLTASWDSIRKLMAKIKPKPKRK